jgi:hypothetical protein
MQDNMPILMRIMQRRVKNIHVLAGKNLVSSLRPGMQCGTRRMIDQFEL